MLSDNDVVATIAVKDLSAARAFYEGKLGFAPHGEPKEHLVTYPSGGSTLLVYVSEFAGTNRATSATWDVGGEFDAIVERLRGAGVAFEHYDLPGLRREGDVHVAGDFRGAWFRDPDGNILHVNNA